MYMWHVYRNWTWHGSGRYMKMSHQSHLVSWYEPSFTCKNLQFIGDQRDSSINKAVGTGQVCETYIDPGSSIVKSFTMQEQGNRSTQESAASQIVTWKALDLGNVDPRLKTPVIRQLGRPPPPKQLWIQQILDISLMQLSIKIIVPLILIYYSIKCINIYSSRTWYTG